MAGSSASGVSGQRQAPKVVGGNDGATHAQLKSVQAKQAESKASDSKNSVVVNPSGVGSNVRVKG